MERFFLKSPIEQVRRDAWPVFLLIWLIPVFIVLSAAASYAEEKRYAVPIEDSPARGPEGAPITIIEFLDYQ